MTEPADSLLVADIGGTRARFALALDGRAGPTAERAVADYGSALEAIEAFIAEVGPDAQGGERPRPRRAAFAVAGPVIEGRAELTNADWVFEADALRAALDLDSVLLLNDFEAIAHALPVLPPEALFALGGGRAEPGGPRAVVGPGTGLGVGGLLTVDGRSLVVRSEGGHASLAAGTPEEAPVVEALRARYGHVSSERALSGEGLVNLYRAVAELAGKPARGLTPAEVTARALSGEDRHCVEALSLFCALLGGLAGDFALTFCARGGVYIAGGIAPRILDFLRASAFRARFEAKGRFQGYLASVPTWVITDPHPAFHGLIAADRERLMSAREAG